MLVLMVDTLVVRVPFVSMLNMSLLASGAWFTWGSAVFAVSAVVAVGGCFLFSKVRNVATKPVFWLNLKVATCVLVLVVVSSISAVVLMTTLFLARR